MLQRKKQKLLKIQPSSSLTHLLLFITIVFNFNNVKARFYPHKISPGLYEESTADPIFYESFVPIVYEFKTPTWVNDNITLRDWRGLCTSDSFAPSYTCPVFFYLERFIERVQAEVVPSVNSIPRMTPSLLNHTIVDKCDRIQKHFPSSFTSNSSFDAYLNSFSNCPIQGGVIKRGISDYVYDIKTIYKKMVTKFEGEFSARAGSGSLADRQGPAYYVNQITASQGLLLFNHWVEHQRWEEAKRDCAAQRIPLSLIKRLNLTQSLLKVDGDIKNQNHVLSIPLTETTSYYNSPLADCTFTESTFAVRILVPIRRKSFNGKLVTLKPLPFLLNDQEEKYSICQIFDMEASYIYDQLADYLVKIPASAQCDGNLCHVPNWSKTSLPNLCATAYFSGNPINVKKYCQFSCEEVADGVFAKFPIFKRISSDTYLVTGNTNTEVVVKCEGKRDQFLNPVKLGSLQIQLPCHCSLNYRSSVFYPEQPCEEAPSDGPMDQPNNISFVSITPIHFFNLEFLKRSGLAQDYNPSGFNFSGVMDANMAEPRLFDFENGGRISSQLDVESGLSEWGNQNGNGNRDGGKNPWDVHVMKYRMTTTTFSTTSVTWLWVLFVIQGIAFICFVVSVNRKLGMFSFPGKFGGDGRLSNRRTISISTQNIINAEHSSRNNNDPENDDYFRE